ncbi:unnamed protein product [Rotaria socialis]|uniref:Uncharacterized protein n=1 Tax=Rotaria socialis TaxID=392032 RepID=A0A820BQH6_9BILA|nr:unnamed protein product [Rotaria socialis]CAF3426247.1 unnamed protein product [Rotaria socialis]CAF3462353.1 unnamed protein product [Rotaria socialis]CAF3619620.1 unnamed protein product [Rotaria socialis]CAF3705103.1 unnamed protein product [Rotaria socialis]
MTTSNHRHSNNSKESSNGHHFHDDNNQINDVEVDSELLELETTLNDIEKAMDKIESQNSSIQTKLRDLLESNKQMAKEFTDIRRGMTSKFKEATQRLEETPGIAHDLAAVTSNTLSKIEQDMSSANDANDYE